MVANVGNILNAVQLKQLTALQRTSSALDGVQLRLASGKDVSSVLDNPNNFFAARGLDNRSQDLSRLLDAIDQSIQTIEFVQYSVDAIQEVLETAESFLLEYEQDFLNGEVEVIETIETDFFIDFDDVNDFISYSGGQDAGSSTVALIEDGHGVLFDDNPWKRYAINQTITADTIIEFDFRSSNIPEIAAIGFDNDNNFANGNTQFFLYGQQTNGINYSAPTPTFEYDGSGDWVHVEIPVGTYFTGNFSHLTFITDDDGGGNDGDAQYRNMVIHEGEYVYGQTGLSVSDIYEQRYSAILNQIDFLADDAHYAGINLLEGDDLTTFFNEDRTSKLITEGLVASSDGLDLDREDFTTIEAIEEKIDQVRAAQETLRAYTSSLAMDFGVLNNRFDFTQNMINTLQTGRDALTLTDQNEAGAELLALQTRQQIQFSTLTINTASIADFLV